MSFILFKNHHPQLAFYHPVLRPDDQKAVGVGHQEIYFNCCPSSALLLLCPGMRLIYTSKRLNKCAHFNRVDPTDEVDLSQRQGFVPKCFFPIPVQHACSSLEDVFGGLRQAISSKSGIAKPASRPTMPP
jgi:hypothetical protein